MRLLKHIYGLLTVVLCMCAPQSHANIKLSGTILHKSSDSVKVSYSGSRLAYYPKEFYAIVDKKGKFSVEFPLPAGAYVQTEIKHGDHIAETVLLDGDSLVIN